MEGEDAEFLDMLARDVAAVRVAAGEIEAQLAGLDIGAGLASSLAGGDLASIDTNELARDLGQQMAGVGAALADDLGTELGQGLAETGVEGGHALAGGVTEGAVSLGDEIADAVGVRLVEPLRTAGRDGADAFGRSFEDEIPEAFRPNVFGDGLTALMSQQGGDAGRTFTATFSHAVQDEIVTASLASMLSPDSPVAEEIVNGAGETGGKAGKKMGSEAGKAAGDSMSPLLKAAIVGGLAIGPGAILAAASVATVGLGALVVRSNRDIQAEYQKLAADVGATLTQATAPLVPAVEASLVSVDGMVKEVAPDIKALFADAEPDLFTFTQGVDSAAEQFLPRFAQAVNDSRGIVADFSSGLGTIGAGAGNFFTGLTTDAQATGRGLEDFERLAGTALGTAGQVIGSFSAAASSALDAIVPAADGVLTVIDKLANPATIGAAGGALGAKMFGSSLQGGLQSISDGFLSVAAKSENAGGLLGKISGAAESASSGFSSMADVMGGPWGMAVGAGIGLLGGFISSLRDSTASASDFTAAIAQDSGEVGSNTEATIQQTLAKQNLSDLNQKLGVDNSTLIAYAAGDKQAQEQVTDAYNAKISAMVAAQQQETRSGEITKASTSDTNNQSAALAQAKMKLDAVTSAVAQAVAQQNEQTAALLAAQKATDIFTQQVDAEKLSLQQAAQTALVNATALNESLPVQGALTSAAINASLAYQQTATAAQAYTSALDALYGKYGDATAAQANFTTQLANLKGQIKSGKDAVDANTEAGAKNLTMLQGAAQAAETYSEKLYEQTGSADQANQALRESAQKLDDAATKAGLTKTQVQELNKELFGVPKVKDITIALDDTHANATLNAFLRKIDTSVGTVKIYAYSSGDVGNLHGDRAGRAAGGPVQAGVTYTVGEQGIEKFTPATDGYITAHSGLGSDGASGGGGDVHYHFHIEGSLIHQDDLPDAMQQGALRFQQRNSYNGLAYA